MKSLRNQLTLGLLLAFSLLLIGAGVVVYFSTRSMLARQFDDTLLAKAVTIASSVKLDKGIIESHFSEHVSHGISAPDELGFFQLWQMGGKMINHSLSLGTEQLPQEFSKSSTPRFFDLKLPGDVKARGVGFCFTPKDENEAKVEGEGDDDEDDTSTHKSGEMTPDPKLGLVVAADRAKLDKTLNTLIFVLVSKDVAMLLVSAWLIDFVLRRGLKPLYWLADQTQHIGAGSLRTRITQEGLPQELIPICERLNDLLSRLEASFNEMSEYASKVTHELRTPLAILRLKVEQSEGKISPEVAEELQAEIQQLGYVVEQSLFIAKAEQGRLKLHPRQFDLAEMVADVAEDFSYLAEEQQRTVRLKKIPATLPLNVDPKYARQIIHNLLSNALKHGQGEILVKLTGEADCALTIINRTHTEPVQKETLGLGLRVVDSLVLLQPGLKFQRRHGRHYYAVRLRFPRSAAGAYDETAKLSFLPSSAAQLAKISNI